MSRRSARFAALLFVFTVIASTFSYAQYRAGIQGTVLDPTGAVVAGATVKATNIETNLVRETTTSGTGFYRVPNLPPGVYTVEVTGGGFQDKKMENIVVTAEQIRGLDITMAASGAQTTVEVTDTGAVLQTENPELGGTFSTIEVKRLPQVNRDPYELLRLTPGTFGLGARQGGGEALNFPNHSGPGGSNSQVFQTENQVPVSANGQRVTANNFAIDGVNVNSQAWGGAAVITPNQEAVKEIRVLSNTYSAENGRNTGAQVQVVTQNGTNDWHGSALVKRGTPGLNAFARWGGPNPGDNPRRVERRFTQWAGSIGGPIVKNHLFFFFSVEGAGNNNNPIGTQWIETPEYVSRVAALRPNTIANQVLTFPGMTPPNTIQTISRTCADLDAGLTAAQCQVVSGGLDIGSIGGSVGSRVASNVGGGLDGIPDIMFVESQFFNKNTSRQYNLRVDYQVTQSDLLAFSAFFVPVKNEFNDAWANAGRPYGDFVSSRRNYDAALLWNRTLSSTMINEARFNVTRWYFNEIESNNDYPWGIARSNICMPGTCINFGPFNPGVFYQTSYHFKDTLTKVVGAHSLKFGGDVTREDNNDRIVWAARPSFDFGNLWNFANDAPTFESANYDPTTGEPTDVRKAIRIWNYSFFVQDDWKLRPNLTLNLGLRYEYFGPFHSTTGRNSNLLLGDNGSLTGARIVIGDDLYEADRNNFGPALGFAWQPGFGGGSMVIRGGYSLGYNRIPLSLTLNSRLNPPFFASFGFGDPAQIRYSLSSDINDFYGFPANPAAVTTFDPVTNLPTTGTPNIEFATLPEVPTPYAHRYSLEIEQELTRAWVFGLGYQGSTNRKMPRRVNYKLFVAPNPNLGNVSMMFTDVNSNFNALLVKLNRRMTSGFMFSTNYRWAKSMDHCSNDDNCVQTYPFDQQFEWGPSDYDVTHSLQAHAVWDVPLFRGRKDALEVLLGGWELSGILTASSGFPWTPVYGGADCRVQVASGTICPVRPIGWNGSFNPDYSTENFQTTGLFPDRGTTVFTPPNTGPLSANIPAVSRNSFRGPRYFSVDMSLAKRFGFARNWWVFGENAGLEFRAQAFNVFNKVNIAPFGFNSQNTQIGNVNFGRGTAALAGRVVEFQARFNF